MEPVSGVAEVAKGAAETVAKTAVDATKPMTENAAQVAEPIAKIVPEINQAPSANNPPIDNLVGLENAVKNLQEQTAAIKTIGGPQTETGVETEDQKQLPTEEAQAPTSNDSGKTTENLVGQAVKDVEAKQHTELTPEQEKVYREEFQNIFQEHPFDILQATKQATALAEAKINESKIREDQNATPEQKTEAAKAMAELSKAWEIKLQQIVVYVHNNNPEMKNPELHPLIVVLKNAPNNPEDLALIKKDTKKSLLKVLLEFALIIGQPIISEIKKTMEAEFPTGQPA